jgi:hypothetical protein
MSELTKKAREVAEALRHPRTMVPTSEGWSMAYAIPKPADEKAAHAIELLCEAVEALEKKNLTGA